MNNSKKINVNCSSLVGLKTELLRKQHEVNEAKLKLQINYAPSKMKKKPKKEKKGNDENSDKSIYIEDVNTHKKSKLMLEAKARLYEQLKKSRTNNDNFLVDFKGKADESEEEILQKDEEYDEDKGSYGNEGDWVEYEDCFGRTRKCLKEDLPIMQEKDKLIKQQIINEKGIDPKTKDNVQPGFVECEKEPEIEIMRRKWEEQTKKLTDKVNIHYQDVLFDEARTHGVGYYAFSQDEEERSKQQENLSKLRKETEHKQKEIKELRELREKMECNRLKAARIRQRVRAGLPIDTIEKEFEQKDGNESSENKGEDTCNVSALEEKSVEVKKSSKEQVNEEDSPAVREDKIKALREILGKKTHWYEMSQEEWVDKCRKVRVSEFGPVYSSFQSAGYLISKNANKSSDSQDDLNQTNVQSNEIDIDSYDIPLPPTLISEQSKSDLVKERNDNHPTEINHSIQHELDIIKENPVKPTTNIDEASIAAGLRYLREKFEKSQND